MVSGVGGLTRVGVGQNVAYGTFDSVYFQDLREPNREPVKMLALTDLAQVDVLDGYGLVLSGARSGASCIFFPPASKCSLEGQVITFPLDAPEAMDLPAGLKRVKRIAAHTSFLRPGIYVGLTFVCVVKTSPLSHDQYFQANLPERTWAQQTNLPQTPAGRQRRAANIQGILRPCAVELDTFLAHDCVNACVNGFEIIDPDTLDTQGFLYPSDELLDFVRYRSDNTRLKPMAI
jgi:hypothetical protein